MISVVMPYHNRRQLLINTLQSILFYNSGKEDFEIIIIDDGSSKENRVEDLPGLFPEMRIYVIWLDPRKKKYINPCIPSNIGFSLSKGDTVLFQNTECLHVGDILGFVRANSRAGHHLTFSLYSVNETLQQRVNKLYSTSANNFDSDSIRKAIGPMVGYKERWRDGDICWYNHSTHRRAFGSFIWAMNRGDLEDMNGFDERYAHGFAWDDAEFTVRLARKHLYIRYSDEPFAVHQYHTPSNYGKMAMAAAINRNLYHNVTLREGTYRAPYNIFFNGNK